MRSCFRSQWRLHPDEPSRLTPGRFYFVHDTTPIYEKPNYLDSRDWDSEFREGRTLGEWDGEREWDDGRTPRRRPRPVVVGSEECIARGGGGDVQVPPDLTKTEIYLPRGCYLPCGERPSQRIYCCNDRAILANIQQLMYDLNFAAENNANLLFGEGGEHTWHEADGLMSKLYIHRKGSTMWVFVDGTRNAGQALTQIYQGAQFPRPFDGVDTTALYDQAATRIHAKLEEAGGLECTRFGFSGHSYGGAAASVAAARWANRFPSKETALVTYGAPRAGGDLLREALRRIPMINYRRKGDPIPSFPPALFHTLPFGAGTLFATLVYLAWGRFRDYDQRLYIDRNPNPFISDGEQPPPTDDTMAVIVDTLLNALPTENFEDHGMVNYYGDLSYLCNNT